MVQQVTTKPTAGQREIAQGIYFVIHPVFNKSTANKIFGLGAVVPSFSGGHMPDDITRECSSRMHYAAWRMSRCKYDETRNGWKNQYLRMRDMIVLGNRKLIFRAIRRWKPPANQVEDMTSDCHIVLIQAVSTYNPWLGIRFSTYAFTCLIRALSRMSRKLQADKLSRSVPLEMLAGTDLDPSSSDLISSLSLPLDELFGDSSILLSPREKLVLIHRFGLTDKQPAASTLEQVGKQLGLSKERVRQVQLQALPKLRAILRRSFDLG